MRRPFTQASVSAGCILAVCLGAAMAVVDNAHAQNADLNSDLVTCVRDAVQRFPQYSDAVRESGAYWKLKEPLIKKLPPELQPTATVDVYEVTVSSPHVVLLVGKARDKCELVGGNIYGPTLDSYNSAGSVLYQLMDDNWNLLVRRLPTDLKIGTVDPVEYVRRLLVIRRWMLRKLVGEIIVVLTPESKILSTIPDTQKKALRIREPEVKKLGAGMTYGRFTVWSSVNGEVSRVTFLLTPDGRAFLSERSIATHIGRHYTLAGEHRGCFTLSPVPDE